MEALLIGIILLFILEYNKKINTNIFIKDNEGYFKNLMEKDYEFFVKAKYGEDVDINTLFSARIRNAVVIFIIFIFIFISKLNFLNIMASLIVAYLSFKMQYTSLRNYYRRHLHEIDSMLPYYLKNIEILIQHYTVPMAIMKSIDDAPNIFKPGLRKMIERIGAGDSSIEPYMEFAREYPVRDSMRMMRLLYRLGLGAQENKQDQLLMFARTVSALQGKAREQRYRDRLANMERRTLVMLMVTGGGTMAILLLSMLLVFGF